MIELLTTIELLLYWPRVLDQKSIDKLTKQETDLHEYQSALMTSCSANLAFLTV